MKPPKDDEKSQSSSELYDIRRNSHKSTKAYNIEELRLFIKHNGAEQFSNINPQKILVQQNATRVKRFNDGASVFSDANRYTSELSSVTSLEYQQPNDALVAIIGVIYSEYDGMPNLDGIVKDYENVLKTFSTH